jgi:hypothetical protein
MKRQLSPKRGFLICMALFAIGGLIEGTGVFGSAAPAPAVVAVAPAVIVPAHDTSAIWLTQGSTGEHVKEAQAILKSWGWSLDDDGHFGPITEQVVMGFQRVSGLHVDGVIGPQTWGALQSVKKSSSPETPAPRWDGPIPEYGNRGRCTQAKADSITSNFASAGASRDTQEWSLLVASRETGCRHNVHVNDSDDDSYSIAQINADSGIFTTKLKGWDRHRALNDWDYAVDMFVELWTECGRGPWAGGSGGGSYYCRRPSS